MYNYSGNHIHIPCAHALFLSVSFKTVLVLLEATSPKLKASIYMDIKKGTHTDTPAAAESAC